MVSIGPITSATAREEGLRGPRGGRASSPSRAWSTALLADAARVSRAPLVAFLTDYGPGSEHVGALHAVVARRVSPAPTGSTWPTTSPPGDVRGGALLLARLAAAAARGDDLRRGRPRGGHRRAAPRPWPWRGAASLVGPDNGLLGPVCAALGAVAAVELTSAAHRREPRRAHLPRA